MLGDLLDQMDGLRPFEDISFLLTTNAIDRMEAAIKDRPGRISQLIHFGAPNRRLRARYLGRYLEPYHPLPFGADELAAISDGANQAFLKEWVDGSVQVATERLDSGDGELQLALGDFEDALAAMKEHAEGSSSEIIGFRPGGA